MDTVKPLDRHARPIPELSVVRFIRPVETDDGVIPAGARGTVVHSFSGGLAYIVEVYEPFHSVATVEVDSVAL